MRIQSIERVSCKHIGNKNNAWIVAAALDSVFLILNAAMMAGYFGFSATIAMLSKSWFTNSLAEKLFSQVTKTFVYGFLNPIMTAVRTVLWRVAGVTVTFMTGKAIDKALSFFGDHLSAVISSCLSWGGLIAGIIDWTSDGKLNGKIVL